MIRVTLLALLALASPSCRTAAPALRVPYEAPAARPAPFTSVDSILRDSPFREVAEARGMPALRSAQLPTGSREIRIADWYSMIAGRPEPMLRVVQLPDRVVGEVLFFWSERLGEHDIGRQQAARAVVHCTRYENASRTCTAVARITQKVDWPRVAADLDSLGAWMIAERCEERGGYTDTGELLIQRLVVGRFDQYRCNAPRNRTATPTGRQALAIYDYFQRVVGQSP